MTHSTLYTQSLLEAVADLARKAGAAAMTFYHGRTSVTFKSDASPLTEADRASHELLVESLPALLAGVPVVSEESENAAYYSPGTEGPFWLVDPLDGTKEFLKGTGEFTVNIALIERGRPVLGVVHAPALALTYLGSLETGAFCQRENQARFPIRVQQAALDRLRVVASKDHAGPMVQALLAQITSPQLKSMGSSLKFCLVAAGEADLYLRDLPTMEWDTAAAQCVVEAAGGSVRTLAGDPLRYGKPGLRNPAIITIGDPALPWKNFLSS